MVKEQVGFIEKPMRRGLQIATDDVDPNYVIGEAAARAVATSNIVPLLVPCALTLVVVEPGCYGWTRPRTKLREDTPEPAPVSGSSGTPATHGGHGHGRGRGAHAEV